VKSSPSPLLVLRYVCMTVLALAFSTLAYPQNAPTRLVTQPVDESQLVTLHGTVHPLAQAADDQGPVSDSFAAKRILLILNRPPEREAGLQQFLKSVHEAGNAGYHQWITPEQFGQQFGPADSDVQIAESWLGSHGFSVAVISKSKQYIEFSGTAGQLREALHTHIHQYSVANEIHYANANDIAIPQALAALVQGFSPLNNFGAKPYVRAAGKAAYSPTTKRLTPQFTNPNGMTNFYALAPEDFATQYDLGPLYKAGTNGSGQTIGIINESNIDLTLPNAYRKLFNLSNNPPQVVMDGDDPGELGNVDVEAYLDVEVSGAVAPAATVNLYIADGGGVQDVLALAALRAIEDNQAAVLSVSFGECEKNLGEAGNQLWSGLWEQAAAQGQTVFVSSGDSGSAACDPAGAPFALEGLAVNGLASSPWNVAVGGTDFYYSDYAIGAPSAATLWNQTNDSSDGSLIAPLPEQPWNEAFGLNVAPSLAFSIFRPTVGGGGGASACAVSTSSTPGVITCQAGHPKPIWQNAPGVPSDGVRDIPDISLFASSGINLSAYPICVNPGDCVATGGAQPNVFLVGGTSASAPAMAGIMALINQKFGRQGQADFTLYALARRQPAVFHDITLGSNNVECAPGTPNCSLDTNGDGFNTLQEYPATPGYDLASGLGTIDANLLVTNWGKISFLPTSITFSLSPATVVHGSAVTINATVAGKSGSGVPSGDIDLATTGALPLQQTNAISLTNGSVDVQVNYFPGGTYQVSALYAGDGVYTTSTSAPVSLTVTPEPSAVAPIVHYSYIDYTTGIGHRGTVMNGQQLPFSSEWTFDAEPTGANSQTSGLATGTVTFTDGTTSEQVQLNSSGTAASTSPSLALGAHSVTASYSGDASYNASSGGPVTFTVGQGIPKLVLNPGIQPGSINGVAIPIAAGSNFTVGILIGAVGGGIAPTGTVKVTLGSTTETATLQPYLVEGVVNASGTVTFQDIPSGNLTLSGSYPGDANWLSATYTDPVPIVVAPSNLLATTTTVSVNPTTIVNAANVKLIATVQGGAGATFAPDGLVSFFVNGVSVGIVELTPSGGTAATATTTVASTQLPNGSDQVIALYPGDFGFAFNPSSSGPVTVSVTPSAFEMAFAETQIEIKSGQTGTASLILKGVNGASETVALACAPSSSSIGCSVSLTSASTGTTEPVTINAFVPAQTAGIGPLRQDWQGGRASGEYGVGLVLVFLFGWSGRKRRWRLAPSVCTIAILALQVACGGSGGGGATSPPPPPTTTAASVGTYSVLVTGTANGSIHNVKLTVIVQ
jgi:subtilase family serine protease